MKSDFRATLGGVVAILLWGSAIAVMRDVTESIGSVTTGALMYILGGAVGLAISACRPGKTREIFALPKLYLFGCGAFFVLCTVTLITAVGLAGTRQEVIEVSIINYLWPSLALALAIPFLRAKARVWLWPGILIGFGGAALGAMSGDGGFDWRALAQRSLAGWFPHLLALTAAVTWGFYSVLSRRWAGGKAGGAVSLFLLIAGLALAAMLLFINESRTWNLRVVIELFYLALLPSLAAYALWDRAMRNGNNLLIASFSFAVPLISAICSSLYLHVRLSPSLWLACIMVIAGAVICKVSITET